MAKKLVIFDCDGVLVDTEFVGSKIFCEAIVEYGHYLTLEECIRKFTGLSVEKCRQMIMSESGIHIPEDYWDHLQPRMDASYEKELDALLQPVLETLETLGVPRCVASNSSRKHVVHCLEITKQIKFFSEKSIFTFQQVPRPKPAPDLFLHAAKEMGVKPQDCIVIEDSTTGAIAAKAAGMEVLLFLGGRHAHYDWYRDQLEVHNRPMISTCRELSEALQQVLS